MEKAEQYATSSLGRDGSMEPAAIIYAKARPPGSHGEGQYWHEWRWRGSPGAPPVWAAEQ
jgi:hypothetical protein